MAQIDIEPTALHEIPADIADVLESNKDVRAKWNAITPLARNEWVCWVTIVKKEETRKDHIMRMKILLFLQLPH